MAADAAALASNEIVDSVAANITSSHGKSDHAAGVEPFNLTVSCSVSGRLVIREGGIDGMGAGLVAQGEVPDSDMVTVRDAVSTEEPVGEEDNDALYELSIEVSDTESLGGICPELRGVQFGSVPTSDARLVENAANVAGARYNDPKLVKGTQGLMTGSEDEGWSSNDDHMSVRQVTGAGTAVVEGEGWAMDSDSDKNVKKDGGLSDKVESMHISDVGSLITIDDAMKIDDTDVAEGSPNVSYDSIDLSDYRLSGGANMQGPKYLVLGDSNAVKLSKLMTPVEGLVFSGHSGASWSNITSQTQAFPSTERHIYAKVFILLGTNDLYNDAITPDMIRRGMDAFVNALRGFHIDDKKMKTVVYVFLPPLISNSPYFNRAREVRQVIENTALQYNTSHFGGFCRWIVRNLLQVYEKHSVTMEMLPLPKHFTATGFEEVLDLILTDINNGREGWNLIPITKQQVWNTTLKENVARKYLHCGMSIWKKDSQHLFQMVFKQQFLLPESATTGIIYDDIFKLKHNRMELGSMAHSLDKVTHTLYATQLRNYYGKAKEAKDYSLRFFNRFFDNILQKIYSSSNYCVLCVQDLNPSTNLWTSHVNTAQHRRNHVMCLRFTIGDDRQPGSIFDRLAFGSYYETANVSIDGYRFFRSRDLISLGLELEARSSIQFGAACDRDTKEQLHHTVDFMRMGSLPLLMVSVRGTLPPRPIMVTFKLNISLWGKSNEFTGSCRCNASVVYTRRRGANCEAIHGYDDIQSARDWAPVNVSKSVENREIYRSNDIYIQKEIAAVSLGVYPELVETYVGISMQGLKRQWKRDHQALDYYSCPVHFLVAVQVLSEPTITATLKVLNEDTTGAKRVERTYTYLDKAAANVDLHASSGGGGDGEDINMRKVSLHIFRERKQDHQDFLKGATQLFQVFKRRLGADGHEDDWMRQSFRLITPLKEVNAEEQATKVSMFARNALQLCEVPYTRSLDNTFFWTFLANLLSMQMLDLDSQDPIDWLLLEHIDRYNGADQGVMYIHVKVLVAGRKFTQKNRPSHMLLSYVDGGGRTQAYLVRVLDAEFPANTGTGVLTIEENTDFSDEDVLLQLSRNKHQVNFFSCRDVRVARNIYTNLTRLFSTDMECALYIAKYYEGKDNDPQFVNQLPKQFLGNVDASQLRVGLVTDYFEQRLRAKPWVVLAFEKARFLRDRLLSGIDCLVPGIIGSFAQQDRLPLLLQELKQLFSDNLHAYDPQGQSIHQWIRSTLASFTSAAVDARAIPVVCDATGNPDDCNCSITKDDISQMVFKRISEGLRLVILEGPVGSGKTVVLCRTVDKLMKWLGQYYGSTKNRAINERVCNPHFILLSSTNSNVENIVQALVRKADILPNQILHFVSKTYGGPEIDNFGVRQMNVPSVPEESAAPNLDTLANLFARYPIITMTVDLFLNHCTRRRAIENTYLFLDEASQVSVLTGLYLMSQCDTMGLFGDTFQTEPYLDINNSLMKAYNVDISIMEFALKCFEAQGEDVKKRHCVRTHFNWRSSPEQCQMISMCCYPDQHFLRAVNGDERLSQARDTNSRLRVFQTLFSGNSANVCVVNVKGSMFTLRSKTHINVDEANTVMYILHWIHLDAINTDMNDGERLKVAVLTLYDGMNQLLTEMCVVHFGSLPAWLDILSIRVSQGRTYKYVILALTESAYADDCICPEPRQAFTCDQRLLTVAISRQELGLVIVCNPIRYVMDPTSPVSKILASVSHRGLFFQPDKHFSATGMDFFNWFYNLQVLKRDQVDDVESVIRDLKELFIGKGPFVANKSA